MTWQAHNDDVKFPFREDVKEIGTQHGSKAWRLSVNFHQSMLKKRAALLLRIHSSLSGGSPEAFSDLSSLSQA